MSHRHVEAGDADEDGTSSPQHPEGVGIPEGAEPCTPRGTGPLAFCYIITLMIKKIETDKIVLPGKSPHSQAIVAGSFIFTQGMINLTPEGNLLEGSLENKVRMILDNLTAVLEEAGASFADVIKVSIYLTDMSNYTILNSVYSEYFSEPYPAREVLCVKELPLGAEVEISMIAHND